MIHRFHSYSINKESTKIPKFIKCEFIKSVTVQVKRVMSKLICYKKCVIIVLLDIEYSNET